jgi:hypothetical protein
MTRVRDRLLGSWSHYVLAMPSDFNPLAMGRRSQHVDWKHRASCSYH